MTKRFLLHILCIQLFCWGYLFSQDNSDQNQIISALEQYVKTQHKEKIYLHTDKDIYTSGEQIMFKAYVINANNLLLNKKSKVLYLEIKSLTLEQIEGKIYKISDGTAWGSLYIPDSTSTGYYYIKAYTNWMKNFNKSLLFTKKIFVINRFGKNGNNNHPRTSNNESKPYTIEFYPEGGNLIYGMNSKIGYRAYNQFGNYIPVNGFIADNRGNKINEIDSTNKGYGFFMLKPEKGTTYMANIMINNKLETFQLPVPEEKGYVMTVQKQISDDLDIHIQTNIELHQNYNKHYLIIHCRGNIIYNHEALFNNKEFKVLIPRSQLMDGIHHITLFNVLHQPISERLVYISPQNNIEVEINSNKKTFGTREKVDMDIEIKNNKNIPISANLSLTVIEKPDLVQKPDFCNNIINELYLTSNLIKESPGSELLTCNINDRNTIDQIMISQKSNEYKWSNIMNDSLNNYKYLLENEGIIIKGRVINKNNDQPISYALVLLSIPDSIPSIQYYISDEKGDFYFILKDLYEKNYLIMQARRDDYNMKDIKIVLEDNFLNESINNKVSTSLVNPLDQTYYEKCIQRANINKIYEQNLIKKLKLDSAKYKYRFYGKPDEIIYPDEYINLPNFLEISRELLSGVKIRKVNNSYIIRIYNSNTSTFFNESPLILLDGVPFFNADKFINLGSKKIQRIEIIKQERIYGDLLFYGVIAIFTKKGSLDDIELPEYLLKLNYHGYSIPEDYNPPDYDTELDNTLPDFRQVLFWDPNIQTDLNGKTSVNFYTSDETGKYSVLIEGMTNNGIPVRKTIDINVKNE